MSRSRVANNPFRTPAVTPNPTGASAASSSVPSYATLPPIAISSAGGSSSTLPPNYSDLSEIGPPSDDEESPEALPELTPRISSPNFPSEGRPSSLSPNDSQYRPPSTVPPSLPPRASSRASDPPAPSGTPPSLSADSFPEAAPPPAYTITPDVGGGELLVQQGPRRPFQRAPEPFLPFPAPQSQGPEPEQQLNSPQRQPPQFAPPPGAPPGHAPPSPSSERPRSQLSNFAQDFYNARPTTPPPDEQQRQPRYAPPPGAPPPPRPRAASTSSGAGSTAPPTSDGRPTTTPTPGHPLLRNGQTLVYPENYYCSKCTPSCCVLLLPPHLHAMISDHDKVTIRATRTMIRRTRAASAGTASASHLRRFSLRARGVARAAGLRTRARASVAARTSTHSPHSGLHKRARNRRHVSPVRILRQLAPLRECSGAAPALGL